MQRSIYNQFVSIVKEHMAKTRQGVDSDGETVDFGAMTMQPQLEKAKGLIDDAVKALSSISYSVLNAFFLIFFRLEWR